MAGIRCRRSDGASLRRPRVPPPPGWVSPEAVELLVTFEAAGAPSAIRILGTGDMILNGDSESAIRLSLDVVDRLLESAAGACQLHPPVGPATLQRRDDGRIQIHLFEDTTLDALSPMIELRVGEWAAHIPQGPAYQAVLAQLEEIPAVRESLVNRDADS